MPGTIGGIPTHPLMVHAVVVLGPLVAALLIVYVAMPAWRVGLRWPTTVLALAGAFCAWAAVETGEFLERGLGAVEGSSDTIEAHAEAGELAAISLYVLAVVVLAVIFLLAKVSQTQLSVIALVLAIAAAGFVGFAAFNAGHSGATAVWGDVQLGTATGGGDGDGDGD